MDIIISTMARSTTVPFPAVQHQLAKLGEQLRLARLRRKLSAQMISDRAGMSRPTLRAIERGDTGVTIGAYANVLACLGLEKDLALVARDDVLGRRLQDAELATKRVTPRRTQR